MDIRKYFTSSKSVSSNSEAKTRDVKSTDDKANDMPATKRPCEVPSSMPSRNYNKKWEKDFPWLEYDGNFQGAFCKLCRKGESRGQSLQGSGGVWITKPFQNWKKAVEKMKAHASSECHLRRAEAAFAVSTKGTIAHQLQHIGDSERIKNRRAIKALIRCTHYLCKQHIPHTTKFSKLVDLVVSCGGKDLDDFVSKAAKNASYTSTDAVTGFVEAIGVWVNKSLINEVYNAPFFSVMADECVDVANIEELSIYCRWIKNGIPEEHFMEILPLKKCDAQSIYLALLEWMKNRNMQFSKFVGMGFDGAATFAGKHSGVQARLKKHAPHSVFVHCRCHKLQLACVQAANSTEGIKHVYTALTTLWKFFRNSPKRCQNLKEIEQVLNLPELKIIKPSDTRWLSHEKCISTVKKCYGAIVCALDIIYQESHQPEALGISKILMQSSTLFAIYLLDYILPQVSKLSKSLQTEEFNLSLVSSLVDATLHTMDDVLHPAAKWVLDLQEVNEEMNNEVGIVFNIGDVQSFQSRVAEPFYSKLKENIQNRFTSQDLVSCFSIFDSKKASEVSTYGEDQAKALSEHYGSQCLAESVLGEEFMMPPILPSSEDLHTEWKTFRRHLISQPKEEIRSQLKQPCFPTYPL